MNKINKYLFSGIIAVSMTACADLDLNPLSEGSSENWYHDETEIEMAINDWWRPDFFPIDGIEWDDDMLHRDGSNDVTIGTITSQWGTAATRWNSLYKAVARATKVIQALDNGTADGINEEKTNQYKGEAYFMLGFAYGELATYYGDCVLNKGMTLEEAYEAVRTPKKEVMAYAYECLDKAIELLPDSHTGQQRPTKGVALGIKARFALYHEDWETAAQAAEQCMNSKVYKLHDNYGELFKADSSPELMFYFKGDLTLKKGYGLFDNVYNYVIRKIGGACNRSPSLELFCSYTCTDGLPINKSPLYNPIKSISRENDNSIFKYYGELIMAKINDEPHCYHKAVVQHLFSALFCEMLGYLNKEIADSEKAFSKEGIKQADHILRKFMELLSKDNGMHRSVTYFADALCYTPKHFSKVIKQACGRAPLDLINETAIEHIKYRLKHSDKSIKEIAEEFNFPNQSFFGKYVKGHLGTSPIRYRSEREG